LLWIYIAITTIAVLLYFSAKFSGADTAITAIDAVEVAELTSEGKKNAQYLVNIIISALATLVANELLGNLGVSLAIGLLTLVILLVGEITPKAYAINNRIKLSLGNARWLYYMTRTLSPLITGLIGISTGFLKLVGADTQEASYLLVSDRSIRQLTSLGVEQGTVDDVEQDIIERALDFADVTVAEIMVDREKVFTIPSGTALMEAKEMIAERAFTRIPVVKDSPFIGNGDGEITHVQEIMGVVYVKDLLVKSEGFIDDFLRPPFIVFPDGEAAELFELMRKDRIHMAIVADEGKLLGIITLEDLIEEVMGEIHDEAQDKQFPDGEPE
jgi:CBS domain containing-hemolysin-like protein